MHGLHRIYELLSSPPHFTFGMKSRYSSLIMSVSISSATSSLVITHALIGEVMVIFDRGNNLENTVVPSAESMSANPWASIRRVRVPERLVQVVIIFLVFKKKVINIGIEGLKEGCHTHPETQKKNI